MPKRKRDDDDDDDEWCPPANAKPKPKNFALLEARKRKFKTKKKIVIKCDLCSRKFSEKQQLYNHRLTHGRYCRY